jgi:hypothetical protein
MSTAVLCGGLPDDVLNRAVSIEGDSLAWSLPDALSVVGTAPGMGLTVEAIEAYAMYSPVTFPWLSELPQPKEEHFLPVLLMNDGSYEVVAWTAPQRRPGEAWQKYCVRAEIEATAYLRSLSDIELKAIPAIRDTIRYRVSCLTEQEQEEVASAALVDRSESQRAHDQSHSSGHGSRH